jgi:hypothetical protein
MSLARKERQGGKAIMNSWVIFRICWFVMGCLVLKQRQNDTALATSYKAQRLPHGEEGQEQRRLDKAGREQGISPWAEGEVQDREEIWGDEEVAWFWEMPLPWFGQAWGATLFHFHSGEPETDGEASNCVVNQQKWDTLEPNTLWS